VPVVPLAKELLRKAIAQGFSVIVNALDATDAVIGYMGENVADGNVLESLKVIPDVPFIVIAMIYSTKMLIEPASKVSVPVLETRICVNTPPEIVFTPPPKLPALDPSYVVTCEETHLLPLILVIIICPDIDAAAAVKRIINPFVLLAVPPVAPVVPVDEDT